VSICVPRLHAVTNPDILALPDLAARAGAIAGAGAVALHARAGPVEAKTLIALARLLRDTGATVLVNDRADIVSLVGAAGVHLPAEGLPVEAARRLVGPDLLIGRSTHHPDEAQAAHEAGADYVFLGPIWETASHPGGRPLGLAVIAAAAPARVIAIGGVTPERAAACRAAGAYGVAAISAVWRAADPAAAARRMLVSFDIHD
jgi:thiamine-phosphate pyrophosphorylase